MVTSKDPDPAEIQKAVAQAADFDRIIMNTCNGHLFRGQLALAEALAATGKPLTVVAMRNPYDIPLLPDCECKIAAYDYSLPALKGLEDVFRGGEMTGVLPVKL
jgi:beta-N-acetylhexosaminidase